MLNITQKSVHEVHISWQPVVKQDAESMLNEVFPCVVACRFQGVKNRSVIIGSMSCHVILTTSINVMYAF